MDYSELEKDLSFIKTTMETATRYTNIPPAAYMAAGVLGVIGVYITYLLMGSAATSNLNDLSKTTVFQLSILWPLILVIAVVWVILSSVRRAREHNMEPWSSLAARMFLSQIPQFFVAGVLTVYMGKIGQFELIPTLWMLQYGLILHSFSYFTTTDMKIMGLLFILFGVISLFVSGIWTLLVLGVSFGGLHTIFWLIRRRATP